MFESVSKFESTIADFFNAPYGVATDCCTHAIELCMRMQDVKSTDCPAHTYLSIPMTLIKLGIDFEWNNEPWQDYYYFKNTNIIDAAVLWKENSYIKNTLMCVSFQYRKHLALGRGGIILTDNYKQYQQLSKMSYDGRARGMPWADQQIDVLGYHYYMTPETAEQGLEKFNSVKNLTPKQWSHLDYPNLVDRLKFINASNNR